MDTQSELTTKKGTKIQKYQALVVGQPGIWRLIRYELVTLFSTWIPGALGLLLRTKLYPFLLKSVGKGVVFGVNVVLRSPNKVRIGDNVVVDDNGVLDGKGQTNNGITIENSVFIGRNTIVYCQNGDIVIGDNVNIGSNCQIFSASQVKIGKNVLIAAYCYLVGGGHIFDDANIPVMQQGRHSLGISIGDNVWLGAGAQVLDGVTIGEGAVIAAGAVVTENIPPFSVAGGIPAKILKMRK
jgi:acetyltransferase-like isoleucine patch superfamily enzyme